MLECVTRHLDNLELHLVVSIRLHLAIRESMKDGGQRRGEEEENNLKFCLYVEVRLCTVLIPSEGSVFVGCTVSSSKLECGCTARHFVKV